MKYRPSGITARDAAQNRKRNDCRPNYRCSRNTKTLSAINIRQSEVGYRSCATCTPRIVFKQAFTPNQSRPQLQGAKSRKNYNINTCFDKHRAAATQSSPVFLSRCSCAATERQVHHLRMTPAVSATKKNFLFIAVMRLTPDKIVIAQKNQRNA
jgi:hypothetical protein